MFRTPSDTTVEPGAGTEPVATFGTSARTVIVCRVCGRTLLMGERSTGFFTREGDGPFDVCELCVPRARRFGLLPRPSTPDEVAGSRRRRRSRRTGAHTGNPARSGSPAAAKLRMPRYPWLRSVGQLWRSRPTPRLPLAAVPVGTAAIPVALAAFNESAHARTLAGLYKTLGTPRASVVPRSATDREVVLTVAWEIVWYQFRILPEGEIECARGTYLSELPVRWHHWNCTVTPAGKVLPPAPEAEIEIEGSPR